MIKLTLPTPCAPTVKSLFPALDQIADKIVAIFDKGDAKDDTIGSNGGYTFTIADLLKNDVNAKASTFFFGDGLDALHQAKYMADHGIVDNHNGTYTATAGHDFEYSVLTGTGLCQSYSVADVDVKDAPPVPHAGACLFTENFDNYANIANPTMWSWAAVNLGNHGWQNAGVDTEVAVNGYAGVMSGTSGGYWFDTQGTSGAIDISHQFYDPTGGQVQVSFDIATENFALANGATAANASFDVKVDGIVVKHITAQDIHIAVGDNKMMHFDVVANTGSTAGFHTLELADTTPAANASDYGFALDSVKISDWVTGNSAPDCGCAPKVGASLFTENFDGYSGQTFQDNGTTVFAVTDLNAANGWTNASHAELGANGYGGIAATSGGASGFWFDTQNSAGPVDISHKFNDANGGKAQLSFDVATQSLDYQGQHYATDPNAAFQFKVDGNMVAQFTAADLKAAGGEDHMLHFDVQFDTGAAGQHTLELVDLSQSGYTGFAIDSIQVHDLIV